MTKFPKDFPNVLGSTNPCPNAVHMEPFSTSAFKHKIIKNTYISFEYSLLPPRSALELVPF